MAELVDAHDSGSCVRKDVEVRVFSSAPPYRWGKLCRSQVIDLLRFGSIGSRFLYPGAQPYRRGKLCRSQVINLFRLGSIGSRFLYPGAPPYRRGKLCRNQVINLFRFGSIGSRFLYPGAPPYRRGKLAAVEPAIRKRLQFYIITHFRWEPAGAR